MLHTIGGMTQKPNRPFLATQRLRAYWEGLRCAKGGLPELESLDPRGFAADLEHIFLAEQSDDGTSARFRLAGRKISTMAGCEMQFRSLEQLFEPSSRSCLLQSCHKVTQSGFIVTIELEASAARAPRHAPVHGRLLLLPLAQPSGRPACFLGCLLTAQDPPATPLHFRISRLKEEDLHMPKSSTKGQLICLGGPFEQPILHKKAQDNIRFQNQTPSSPTNMRSNARGSWRQKWPWLRPV